MSLTGDDHEPERGLEPERGDEPERGFEPAASDGDDDEAARAARRQRRRRGMWIRIGLIVLLVVLVTVAHHSTEKSKTLPAGRWGETIACLERNTTVRVTEMGTTDVPSRSTRSVTITQIQRNEQLAFVRDAGSAAAAHAVVSGNRFGELSRADYRVAGPIVWGFSAIGDPPTLAADAGQRTLIGFCARTPGAKRT